MLLNPFIFNWFCYSSLTLTTVHLNFFFFWHSGWKRMTWIYMKCKSLNSSVNTKYHKEMFINSFVTFSRSKNKSFWWVFWPKLICSYLFQLPKIADFSHSHTQQISSHNMSKKQFTVLKTKFLIFHLPQTPVTPFQQMATPTLQLFKAKVLELFWASLFFCFPY